MQDTTNTIRVYLIDDHPGLRDGLARALEAEPGMAVAGQAGTAAEALREIPALKPDVVLVDLNIPDRDGMELLVALRTQNPTAKLLVLSAYDDEYRVIGSALGFGGVTGFDIRSFLVAILGAMLLLVGYRMVARGSHARI